MSHTAHVLRRYLPILAFISVLTMYIEMAVLPSIYRIENEFSVSASEVSWVLSAETLGGLALAPVIGKLADEYGKKRVLMIVLVIYTVSVLFTSISPNFSALVAFRALQGIGLGINPIAYTILRERLPREQLPMAQGIIASTFAIGGAVALPIGAFIAQYYDWQTVYWTALPLLIAAILVAYRVLPDSRGNMSKEPIDLLGLASLSLSFLIIGLALTYAHQIGWTSPLTLGGVVIGLIVFGLFLSHSRRAPNPIISIEDFSNPNVAVPLLASFVSGFGLFLLFQALVYLFELPRPVGFGMDILSTGITLAPISIIMLIVGPAFGALSGRVGVKPILVVAPLIAALGSLILAVTSLDYSLTVADVMITLVVTLIGIGGMMVTRITVLMMSASERRLATITGTNTTMRLMGNTLGPVFASSILDTYKQGVLMGMLGKLPILYMVPSRLSFYYIFMSSAVSSILTALIALKVRETVKGTGKVKVSIPVQG